MRSSDVLVFALLIILLFQGCMNQNELSDEIRKYISFNDNWQFVLADSNSSTKSLNWQNVNVPHTWNARDSFDKTQTYFRGNGWYKKSFTVDSKNSDNVFFLFFEGVNQVCNVYVNGKLAGQHTGGYTAFNVNITSFIKFGEQNTLLVKVNNSHDADIPPLNADFTFYGGIYRDVYLLSINPVHFTMDQFSSVPVKISTTAVSAEQATVLIKGFITNSSTSVQNVTIGTEIKDVSGKSIYSAVQDLKLAENSIAVYKQDSIIIDSPHLWSPENPYLYKVISTVSVAGKQVDKTEQPLGLRWFKADPQKGFFLNGKSYRLFGTNRHQDFQGIGNALTNGLHKKDIEIIKENGFNFLRLAHYPQDPAILEAADELGLIIWEEIPVVNMITLSENFKSNCRTMLMEMISQHYNHPSILFWGYMNEIMLRKPETISEGYYDEIIALANELDEIAHNEDQNRLTVMAISHGEIDNGTGLDQISDIIGFNLYFGWYHDTFADFGPFLDDYHKKFPQRPLMISEYGAGSDELIHTIKGERFDFSCEYQQSYHEETFRQIYDRPWIAGSAIWNQFDFGSSHRQDTKFSINQKGIWFYDRTPKDISYYYKAILTQKPLIYIAGREWLYRAGSSENDRIQPVVVYSNLDSLDLIQNSENLGGKKIANAKAVWNVSFKNGSNNFKARGYSDGKIIEDALEMHFDDRSLIFDDNFTEGKILAVNCGAHEQFIDSFHVVWQADQVYTQQNKWGVVADGEKIRTHHRIFGTQDDPLYQTAMANFSAYRFDLPRGKYKITFILADISENGNHSELKININDQSVSRKIDKNYTAYRLESKTEIKSNIGLELKFESPTGYIFINGLKIEKL